MVFLLPTLVHGPELLGDVGPLRGTAHALHLPQKVCVPRVLTQVFLTHWGAEGSAY